MICIQPTNLNTQAGIERLYGQVATALTGERRAEPLSLDCSWIAFVPPEGIVTLITVARLWHQATGRRIRLCNLQSQVHKYLERMDLFTQCAAWLVEEQPLPAWERFDRSANSATLLEVLPIAGDEGQNCRDVLVAQERASRIVAAWFDADANAVGRLLTMLAEIASNVVHSGDRGFAAIQRYRGPNMYRLGSRVTMAIGDLGIGIEASLRGKTNGGAGLPASRLEVGSDYLLHALQLGVTGGNTVGGLGLSRVKDLVEQWDGLLVIRSRRSQIQASAEGVEARDDLADVPGTQVTIFVRGALEEGW